MVGTNASTFPALRARMGDWVYYATVMSFFDVARWVTRTDQIHSNERLRDWIQRELQKERLDEIAKYIIQQPQHFFNAIIVGIHEGDPEWFPVTVGDSIVLGSPQLDKVSKGAIGLLRLKGGEKVFAIDGQHRVEGIIRALNENPSVSEERLCVLFVAHYSTTEGRERTRRLFSTVNRNAKPVSKGEIVALDEDDAFAVVTRRLVEEFEYLKGHRVAFGKQTPIKKSDASAVTTILGLYDIVQIIHVSQIGATVKTLRSFTAKRPTEATLEAIYKQQVIFWKTLKLTVPEIAEVLTAKEEDRAAGAYRRPDGGHLLFRPAGQKAFARAVRVLMNRQVKLADAVRMLAKVQFELNELPWRGILWDEAAKVMITKHTILAQNLFLHLVGFVPDPMSYPLDEKYFALTRKPLPKKLRSYRTK
jgi:DNA sulfur modification protein DndB